MDLETIHLSQLNGQFSQMVAQIEEYGVIEFWPEYKGYLGSYRDVVLSLQYFTEATIHYFKIKGQENGTINI